MSRDSQINQNVLAELKWDPSVVAARIGVTTKNGLVTLTGQVQTDVSRYAAERAARGVDGVTRVANNITLMAQTVNVSEVGALIQRALERSWYKLPQSISITARKDGKVKLTGFVHTLLARSLASDAARTAPGSTGVENNLVIN